MPGAIALFVLLGLFYILHVHSGLLFLTFVCQQHTSFSKTVLIQTLPHMKKLYYHNYMT